MFKLQKIKIINKMYTLSPGDPGNPGGPGGQSRTHGAFD